MGIASSAPVYTVACDTTGCTNTWEGTDLSKATGWVFKVGVWPLNAGQPATTVGCPTHNT